MADIQPGDHLLARGAVENNVFVPKTVIVIGAEQWKRMQEFGNQARGEGGGGGRRRQQGQSQQGGGSGTADTPAPAPAPTPQREPQH
jgi:hypothetical protein